jgi:hypothetical protein
LPGGQRRRGRELGGGSAADHDLQRLDAVLANIVSDGSMQAGASRGRRRGTVGSKQKQPPAPWIPAKLGRKAAVHPGPDRSGELERMFDKREEQRLDRVQQKMDRDPAASLRASSPASEPEAPAADSAGGRSQHELMLSPPRPDQDLMEEDSSPAPVALPAMSPRDVVGTGLHQQWLSLEGIEPSGRIWDSTFMELGSLSWGGCMEAGVDANAGVLLS